MSCAWEEPGDSRERQRPLPICSAPSLSPELGAGLLGYTLAGDVQVLSFLIDSPLSGNDFGSLLFLLKAWFLWEPLGGSVSLPRAG